MGNQKNTVVDSAQEEKKRHQGEFGRSLWHMMSNRLDMTKNTHDPKVEVLLQGEHPTERVEPQKDLRMTRVVLRR